MVKKMEITKRVMPVAEKMVRNQTLLLSPTVLAFWQGLSPGKKSANEAVRASALAIARHNVESCGGKITILSELGAGTSVTIWLPANAID